MGSKMWGGRFSKKTDPLVERFTQSIQYDRKLAFFDVLGSLLHVKILKKGGYLNAKEAARLTKAMQTLLSTIVDGAFKPSDQSEDIHTDIQNYLQRKVGDLALKLHTARSRNDQVVFAMKGYCHVSIEHVQYCISQLAGAIAKLAKKNAPVIIPGFTHLQHAQPVYLKDYLNAYIEKLKRDWRRLNCIAKNMTLSMGSGALAGTPVDAAAYFVKVSDLIKGVDPLKKLRVQPASNSLDTVSDRDFVIEIISALSIVATHLSRLSEDLILWSTKEFDFIDIDESYCTGSSLMPQKKNPDVLELTRGYAGRLYGNLVSVLTMMKGLPLTYNRDMQLDKEPLFNSIEIVADELKVMAALMKTLTFKEDSIKERLKDESLYATDIVYYLVQKGIPFKSAHSVVGKLVKYSADNALEIKNIPEIVLKKFSGVFVKREIEKLFDPVVSVRSKRSIRRKKTVPR
ncbi:MAG: argininosuccinate lyase [Candidatus Omnitrophota bacterium]